MQYCHTTAAVSCKLEENVVTRASQLVFFAKQYIRLLKGLAACTIKINNINNISVGKSVGNTPSGKCKYR
jgi:hypothetical protein